MIKLSSVEELRDQLLKANLKLVVQCPSESCYVYSSNDVKLTIELTSVIEDTNCKLKEWCIRESKGREKLTFEGKELQISMLQFILDLLLLRGKR